MPFFKKFMLVLAVLIVISAIFLFLGVRKFFTPTAGERIAGYENPSKALLVIDVQEDFTGINSRLGPQYRNAWAQISVINRLIERATETGMHVVYIRHIFHNNYFTRKFIGRALEGFPGAEADGRIRIINENDFIKKVPDAFSNPDLEEFLISNHVDEIYLAGLDAAYCVYYTALGALNRGYKVTVIEDAVMTRKNLSNVLKRYEDHDITISSSKNLIGM